MANYIVTATSLRIRSGPGTSYAIIGTIAKGIVVQGTDIKGDWVSVIVDGKSGWCNLPYLKLTEDNPPTPTNGISYKVTASTLNVRQGPGKIYAIVGTVAAGNILDGLALSADNQWAQVRSAARNISGWCSLQYMTKITTPPPPPDPEPDPTPEPTGVLYRVDASTLNVRRGPAATFESIGSLALGDMVDELALSPDNQWAQIRSQIKNITGWASLKYLTKQSPPPPPAPGDVQMFVTSAVLNYHNGPADSYPVTGQLNKGEAVIYLNATPDWKWVNFKTAANITGWASSKFLTESNDLFADQASYPALGLHRALSEAIPLRAEANETSAQVAPMKFNRVVKVDSVSPDGKWKHCTNAWGEQGWYPIERLEKLNDDIVTPRMSGELPWLSVAFSQLGVRETPGAKHNPRIVEYLMSTDLAEKYPSLPDETDWCASFVNWCVKKARLLPTNSALVGPWMHWGKASNPPQRGAVTSFIWDDGWAHVSLYLGEVGNYVICLGGNQSDAVWISVYHKKYAASYRVM